MNFSPSCPSRVSCIHETNETFIYAFTYRSNINYFPSSKWATHDRPVSSLLCAYPRDPRNRFPGAASEKRQRDLLRPNPSPDAAQLVMRYLQRTCSSIEGGLLVSLEPCKEVRIRNEVSDMPLIVGAPVFDGPAQ